MKRCITLHDREVEYALRASSRARNMRLAIYPDGALVVTAPERMALIQIERFIMEKAHWILDKLTYVAKRAKKTPNRIFLKSSKKEYQLHKEHARAFVIERLAYFNMIYTYEYKTVRIKNQKSRWGSCSKRKNLNFNYKILDLPAHLADYIIVHELCHLQELNHSKRFWNLVEKGIPEYQSMRRELKRYVQTR